MITIVITSLMMCYHNVDAMRDLFKETINQTSKIPVSDSDKNDEVISQDFLKLVEDDELVPKDKAEKINRFIKKYPNITTNNEHAVSALSFALDKGNETVINYLFDNGIDANISNSQRNPALMFFAKKGNLQRVKDLIKTGADVSYRDILYSVDDIETLTYLVENGAQLDVTDTLGNTLLDRAISESNKQKVQWLIEHGAKITVENEYGLLHEAVWINSKEIFLYLIDKGADVKKYVDKLLWVAINGDNTEIIQYLVENGANVNAKDNKGKTLLMYAIFNRANIKIVECLVENGANVNAKDNNGNTPLKYAVEKSKEVDANEKDKIVKIIEYLVGEGTDINAKDNKGNTPLDCITNGNLKIIQCLLKHDAKESIPSTEEPKSEGDSQK